MQEIKLSGSSSRPWPCPTGEFTTDNDDSDGHDGVIYTDLLEQRETCRSGGNNVDGSRQHAQECDILDFGTDLREFIAEEFSKAIGRCAGFQLHPFFEGVRP